MIDNQVQLTDQLSIINGSSHFFGNWVLEVLCSSTTNGGTSNMLQHAAQAGYVGAGKLPFNFIFRR